MLFKYILLILIGTIIILFTRINFVVEFIRKFFSFLFYAVPGSTVMRKIFSKKEQYFFTKFVIIVFGSAFVIIGLILIFINPQNKGNNYANNALILENIKNNVQLIDQEQNYQIKTLTNEEFMEHITDGGGELTGYFKDGEVYKIKEWLGLSYAVFTFEYYFDDEKLIYIYQKEEDFPYIEETGSLDYYNPELAFEGHYYYDNGKLIGESSKGQQRFGGMRDVSYFIESARQNIELLKTM